MRRWVLAEVFDPEKFKARYGLADVDFEVTRFNGQTYVRWRQTIALPDDPPVFEAPDALPPFETKTDIARELAVTLLPSGTAQQKAQLARLFLKLIGEVPPDRPPS